MEEAAASEGHDGAGEQAVQVLTVLEEEVAQLRVRMRRLEELLESLCDWAWMKAWRGPWRPSRNWW